MDGESPQFRGKGLIKCAGCGQPTRDHPLRPCDSFGGERLTVTGNRAESQAARRIRERRAREKATNA